MDRSKAYEFKFKRKKIVLKLVKPKSSVGNNKEGTVIEKNNTTPYYLVTRSHFSPESPIDGFTPTSKNFLGLLLLPLSIPPIATNEPSAPHLYELHEHNTR